MARFRKHDNENQPHRRSVLLLISSLYGGGAEKVCCVLASCLAKENDVAILYLSDSIDGKTYPLDPRVKRILLRYKGCAFRKAPLRCLAYKCLKINAVRKVKRERHVDVSVSLLREPNLLNVFSRQGERVITSERANPRIYLPEKFWQTRLAYTLSDHVVFQSKKVQNLYGPRIRSRSSVIMNPVSVSCHAAENRKKRIVTAGRLVKQKNHQMLISSFAAFHLRYPEYTLTIYGEGEERENLQKQIETLNLQEYAFLPGNEINLHEQIRDAEIFVLSSNFEGLSNSLLECMTMGIACISTRCEGSEDVIRHMENGILIDIGDEHALTESLCALAADPALRTALAKKAKSDSAAFDKNNVIQRWEEVLFKG